MKTTPRHNQYRVMLQDDLPVICLGSQGTGKTYGAVEEAVKRLKSGKVRQIIASRPNVGFAETLGFLPGTEEEKMGPWVRPMNDLFIQFMSAAELENYKRTGRIQYIPFEHIQGLTFDNSMIILDEAQNASFHQLSIFLGRQGMYSKTVICGDVRQTSELFKKSGLGELREMVRHTNVRAHTMSFTLEDCVRSPQCKDWLQAFEDWEDYTNNR